MYLNLNPAANLRRKGPFAFHYAISDAVVYLAMTPKSYPKRAIFRYLYLDVSAAREAWSKRDRAGRGGECVD